MNDFGCYKIGVNVPLGMEQTIMDAVNGAVKPLYPGYDRCFNWWEVNGTWRPLEGSNPYLGTPGEIETAKEVRIEFAVRREDLEAAVSVISAIHPYEEPAIDIIPMIPWKDVLRRDHSFL